MGFSQVHGTENALNKCWLLLLLINALYTLCHLVTKTYDVYYYAHFTDEETEAS